MAERGSFTWYMAFLLVSFWLGERVLFDLQALPSLWVSVRQVVGVGPGQAPDGLSFTALHPHFPINQIYYSTVHHIYKVKIMLKSSEQLWASSDCRLMNSANVFCSLSNPTIYTALIKRPLMLRRLTRRYTSCICYLPTGRSVSRKTLPKVSNICASKTEGKEVFFYMNWARPVNNIFIFPLKFAYKVISSLQLTQSVCNRFYCWIWKWGMQQKKPFKSQSQTEHENLHSFWKLLPSALSSILSLA